MICRPIRRVFALLLFVGLFGFCLTGCRPSGESEVATNGKFKVIEDDDSDSSESSADPAKAAPTESGASNPTSSASGSPPSSAAPSPSSSSPNQPSSTPARPSGNAAATSSSPEPARNGSDNASANSGNNVPPSQPPSLPADALNSYEVPDGTPQQMLDFIASVDATVREMTTSPVPPEQRNLVRERIRQAFVAKEKAATKAYAEAKEPEVKFVAAQAKLEALLGLVGLGDQGVTDRVVAFAKSLANSPDKRLVQQGRQLLVSIEVGKLSTGKEIDVDALLKSLEVLLAESEDHASLVDIVQNTVAVLNTTGNVDEAVKLLDIASKVFQQSKNPEVARLGRNFAQQVAIQGLDFQQQVAELMRNPTPEAEQAYLASLEKIKEIPSPGEAVLFNLTQAMQPLEYTGRFQLCRKTCEVINEIYGAHPDEQLRNVAKQETQDVLARLDMIGKPLAVAGLVTLDGKPFDWQSYRGKVVLVDFWLARAKAWEQQLPELKKIYEEFHPSGFEIIGVSLDGDPAEAQEFLKRSPLPWPIVRSADPMINELAEQCHVRSVPFSILVDGSGKVVDLYPTPQRLREHLAKLLQSSPSKDATESPAAETPAKKTDPPQSSQRESSLQDDFLTRSWTVSMTISEPPDESADDGSTGADKGDAASSGEGEEALPAAADTNPYVAPQDAKPQQLVLYLLEMSEKPKSIQARPAFREAMVDAAERLMKQARNDRDRRLAAIALFEWLHEMAFDGDAEADRRLAALADELQGDPQAVIARTAKLYGLEQQALHSGDLAPEKIGPLLDELYLVFSQLEAMDGRHLRMASATVRAINQLEDDAAREKEFQRFGKLFAESRDVELRNYGKKLIKPVGGGSALVGKPLELDGVTDLGTPFDWKSYRGKWVLVDFWATWCGPCRREMPHVKALYEKWRAHGFDVVGVNLDRNPMALGEYLKQNPLPWTQLVGEGAAAAAQAYGVKGIPTMMLVDPEGNVVAVAHQVEQLRPEIERRLKAKAGR